MNQSLLMVAALIVLPVIGCKTFFDTKKDSDKNQVQPPAIQLREAQTIDLAGFTYPSNKSVPMEKRCEGQLVMLREFFAKDVPEIQLSEPSCSASPYTINGIRTITMNLTHGQEKGSLTIEAMTRDPDPDVRLSFMDRNGNYLPFNPEKPTRQIEAELLNLVPTLKAWLASDAGSQTIFGKPAAEFFQDFIAEYASESSERPILDSPLLRLVLLPSGDDVSQGKVQFKEISRDRFHGRPPNFLNCESEACLNDGQTEYFFEENVLILERVSNAGNRVTRSNYTLTADGVVPRN